VLLNSGMEAVVSVVQDNANARLRGLHQAAQPLTVLQGTLELALMRAKTVEQYRHSVEQSLEQLQRLTDCFEHLRTLIQLHPSAADVAPLMASSLVKPVPLAAMQRARSAGVPDAQPGPATSGEERVRARVAGTSAELTFCRSLSGAPTHLPKLISPDVRSEAKQPKGAVSLCLL
jgi:hypothetical protein